MHRDERSRDSTWQQAIQSGVAKKKGRRTTAAPATPTKGRVEQHMADAPNGAAGHALPLHVKSPKAQVGRLAGSRYMTLVASIKLSLWPLQRPKSVSFHIWLDTCPNETARAGLRQSVYSWPMLSTSPQAKASEFRNTPTCFALRPGSSTLNRPTPADADTRPSVESSAARWPRLPAAAGWIARISAASGRYSPTGPCPRRWTSRKTICPIDVLTERAVVQHAW